MKLRFFWKRFLVCAGLLAFSNLAHSASPKLKAGPPPLRMPETESSKKISPEVKAVAEAGIAAFAKGDLETARKQFQKLLALSPDNLTGLINLGSVEYRLGHAEVAEKLLKKAVRIQPEAAMAWLTLGVIYNDENKLDAALAAVAQAVNLEPNNPRVHNYLAAVIGKKGWYSGAESELQRAIELDPDFAEAHFNLALAYLQRTPPAIELARRHYQKALDLGSAPDSEIEKQLAAPSGVTPNP